MSKLGIRGKIFTVILCNYQFLTMKKNKKGLSTVEYWPQSFLKIDSFKSDLLDYSDIFFYSSSSEN